MLFVQTIHPWGQALSDEDIIEALALLLSETDDRPGRQGRQEFEGQGRPVFNLDPDDLEQDRGYIGRQKSARQDFENVLGECKTTGYETKLVI